MNILTAAVVRTESDEAHAARIDWFDENMPEWRDRERFGEDVLTEGDFAPESLDTVSDEDWAAFIEDSWVDPTERAV